MVFSSFRQGIGNITIFFGEGKNLHRVHSFIRTCELHLSDGSSRLVFLLRSFFQVLPPDWSSRNCLPDWLNSGSVSYIRPWFRLSALGLIPRGLGSVSLAPLSSLAPSVPGSLSLAPLSGLVSSAPGSLSGSPLRFGLFGLGSISLAPLSGLAPPGPGIIRRAEWPASQKVPLLPVPRRPESQPEVSQPEPPSPRPAPAKPLHPGQSPYCSRQPSNDPSPTSRPDSTIQWLWPWPT